MTDVLSLKIIKILGGFLLLYFIVRYVNHLWVFMPVRLYGSDEVMTFSNHFFFNYIPYTIYALLKIFLIACILYLGVVLYNLEPIGDYAAFSGIFKTVIVAELAYLLQVLCGVIYFVIFKPSYSFDDYNEFSPFSLYSITGDVVPIADGLLKGVNLFELLHIFILVEGIRTVFGVTASKATTIVLSTYGAAFLLWHLTGF